VKSDPDTVAASAADETSNVAFVGSSRVEDSTEAVKDFPEKTEDSAVPSSSSPEAPVDASEGWKILAIMVAVVVFGEVFLGSWLTTVGMMMLIVIPMVVFHEWGHYITAKRSGVAVREFFVGFGPRLWSFRRGETEYGVKAFFPLGGYVKIVGMSRYEEVRPEDEGRTFLDASPLARSVILSAGSTANFVTALVLSFVLLAFVGLPGETTSLTTVNFVQEGSSAAEAGIISGDTVQRIAGDEIAEWDDLVKALDGLAGQTVPVLIERDGAPQTVQVTLSESPTFSGRGFLGVEPVRQEGELETESIFSAIPNSFVLIKDIVVANVEGFGEMFEGENLRCIGNRLTGGECSTEVRPTSLLGVSQVADQSREVGLYAFLFLLIMVNVVVGALNLMPLPPLDGGHLAVLFVGRIASRVLRREVTIDPVDLMPLTVGVMGFFLLLFLGTFYLDIVDPLRLP